MDARSIALLEFPQVRARLAEKTSFDPSRRLAEALEPSADPVIVARGLDETDQTRQLLQERPGRRDRGGPRHRPVDRPGGPRRAPGCAAVPRDRRDARRRRAPGDVPRRGAAAAAPRPGAPRSTRCRPCAARCSAASTPSGELLDTASPRLGPLRGAVRVAYDRLRRRLDSLVGSELGGALQEPIITLRNGRYVVPVRADARSRVKGIVHDASGQRPDAVRGAAGGRGAGQRLARGAGRGRRGGGPDPRRAVGARRGERHDAPRDARRARPVRLLGRQGAARRGAGRRSGRPRRRARRSCCCRRATRG